MKDEYITYEEYAELNPVDLIFYILKRWKLMIVLFIVGTLLGYGVYEYKCMKAKQAANVTTTTTVDVSEYDISDKALAQMATAYEHYEAWNTKSEYLEQSILMNLDPNEYYIGVITMSCSATEDMNIVWSTVDTALDTESVIESMKDAAGYDCQTSYVKELVNAYSTYYGAYGINETSSEFTVNRYSVAAADEDSCAAMVEVLSEALVAAGKSYNVKLVATSVYSNASASLLEYQQSEIASLNTSLTSMTSILNAFSDEELEYYEATYFPTEEVEEVQEVTVTLPSLKKWLAIGALAGVVIWGLWCILVYLLDKTVKTVDELKKCYMLDVVGYVRATEPKGVAKLYASFKQDPEATAYVVSTIDTMGLANVILCGDLASEQVKAVADELAKACKSLKCAEPASKSVEALAKVKAADAEILVVRLGETKRSDVGRELDVCRMQGVKLAGVLVVD